MHEIDRQAPELNIGRDELERAFPDGSYFLGILAIHGFEPPIIAANIGIAINDELEAVGLSRKPIILPHFYLDRPAGTDRLGEVLRDEFPDHQGEIFLSKGTANTLDMTEFDRSGYQNHLERVAEWQELTQTTLRQQLEKPFSATSLDGSHNLTINPGQKTIEINAGANVTATEEAHSIFPVRFSDLIEFIKQNPDVYETYDPDTIRRVERIAKKMEESHRTTQIPDHHSMMAEDWFRGDGIIFIPHLKDPKVPREEIEMGKLGGIYINVSGSGIGEEMASRQARALKAKGWTVLAPGVQKIDGAHPAGPDALFLKDNAGKPRVKGFVMRPGYGSIWNSIEAEIGIGYLPGGVYDNPEIKANEHALKTTGIGLVFSPRHDIIDLLDKSGGQMSVYKQSMYERLNLPYGTSGIRVAAQNIIKSETGRA